MEHFVYIIYAQNFDKYYKGYSTHPYERLLQHNNLQSKYTAQFAPWILIYLEKLTTKSDALMREKTLKKYSKAQIKELIKSQKNILMD